MSVTSYTIGSGASPNPGLVWIGDEGSPPYNYYFEDRENAGFLYRVENASFDGTKWTVKDPTKGAFAFALNVDGSIIYLAPYNLVGSTFPSWQVTGKHGVYDVRDFGAKGNGSDDTTAINAALAAIPLATGGVLYFPPGNYAISSTLLLSNYTLLLGAGYESTTLVAYTGFNGISGSNVMIANTAWNDNSNSIQQYDIYVQGITINGNAPTNSKNGKGLITLHEVQNCGVSQCQLINSCGDGIQISLQGDTTKSWANLTPLNYQIKDNIVNLCQAASITSGFAIRAIGARFGVISGNLIGDQQNATNSNPNDSIGPAGCSNLVIANNNIFNGGDGINSMGCDDVVISGNVIQSCGGLGIETFQQPTFKIAVSRITITDNIIDSPNKSGIAIADSNAVMSGDHAHDYVVSNNVLSGSGMSPNGIHIQAYNGVVSGNVIDLQGSNNVGIALDGSYCQCTGNQIWNGGTSSTGITLGAGGSVTSCAISDNIVNIVSPGVAISPTFANLTMCAIKNNLGFNPPPATSITQPTLVSTVVTNPFPYDCMVYIKGATVTGISIDGLSTGLLPPCSVRVTVGGTIQVSFTILPTWVWIPE